MTAVSTRCRAFAADNRAHCGPCRSPSVAPPYPAGRMKFLRRTALGVAFFALLATGGLVLVAVVALRPPRYFLILGLATFWAMRRTFPLQVP